MDLDFRWVSRITPFFISEYNNFLVNRQTFLSLFLHLQLYNHIIVTDHDADAPVHTAFSTPPM